MFRAYYYGAVFLIAGAVFAAQQPPTELEGLRSQPIPYTATTRPLLKWELLTGTAEQIATYRWRLWVGAERLELAGVTCNPPAAPSPPPAWVCEVLMPELPPGEHLLMVQAYFPVFEIVAPASFRIEPR